MTKTRIFSFLTFLGLATLLVPTASADVDEEADAAASPPDLVERIQSNLSATLLPPGLLKEINSSLESKLPPGLWEEIRKGFSARINLVGFGLIQKPLDFHEFGPIRKPVENAINRELGITNYQTELDLRPDFYLSYGRIEWMLKPRLRLLWRKWERGASEGDADFFIQEWLARFRVVDSLFVSYGRENLQWGPSYLLSPSNPFNQVNGKNNPQLEVPGMDYGKVAWIPNSSWAASFIANTDNGRVDVVGEFKRTYALKLDYTGKGYYVSLIPSYRERERDHVSVLGTTVVDRESGGFRFGFLGGWTVSDALLLHTEGTIAGSDGKPSILVGGSYTLRMGPTLTLEYFHNEEGCSDNNVLHCFVNIAPGSVKVTADNIGLIGNGIFLRKNYLLFQYLQTRILDRLNVTARWIRNLDDNANHFVGIFEYGIEKRTNLFFIGSARALEDNQKTDFRLLPVYSVMLGVNFTF